MARVTHTAQALEGPYSNVGKVLTFTAADVANKEQTKLTGKELIVIKNDHATLAKTVTVTSVADPYNRTRDIAAFSIAAVSTAILGPFTGIPGWIQTDGNLYFEGESTDIKFAVAKMP